MQSVRWILIAAIAVACARTETTAPSNDDIAFEPLTSLRTIADAGVNVAPLPSVKVYRKDSGEPLSEVPVQFTMTNPSGATTTLLLYTDKAGVASLPKWRLADTPGQYVATATVAGQSPLAFAAYVRGKVVAVYDLNVNSGRGPTEGHIVLFEGGIYSRFYNTSVEKYSYPTDIIAPYTRNTSETIDFYFDPWKTGATTAYNLIGSHVGFGRIQGSIMTVFYDESGDFAPEEFFLR